MRAVPRAKALIRVSILSFIFLSPSRFLRWLGVISRVHRQDPPICSSGSPFLRNERGAVPQLRCAAEKSVVCAGTFSGNSKRLIVSIPTGGASLTAYPSDREPYCIQPCCTTQPPRLTSFSSAASSIMILLFVFFPQIDPRKFQPLHLFHRRALVRPPAIMLQHVAGSWRIGLPACGPYRYQRKACSAATVPGRQSL